MAFLLSGASSSLCLPKYTKFVLRKREVKNGREREREWKKDWRRHKGRKREMNNYCVFAPCWYDI